MRTDLLHLSRQLRRSPGSALAAIAMLALTLGAAASILALVDAVLLTPPPFASPESLYTVGEVPIDEHNATPPRRVTLATLIAWRDRAQSLASFEAFDGTNLTLTGNGPAERLRVTDATPGLLPLLGVSPMLGREFAVDDVGRPVVIASHAFWRGALGANLNVIGRELMLGDRSHTVIGVLPASFVFALGEADLWRPLSVPVTTEDSARVQVVARLNYAAAPELATSALEEVSRRNTARVVVTPIALAIAGERRGTLILLGAAAAVATLIAFANLAGLLVVRAMARRRELAVRTALGAHPRETVRQLLLESSAIVALGTIGGLFLAWWMTPAVSYVAIERLGELGAHEPGLSGRVIVPLVVLAGILAAICALLPASAAGRWSIVDGLHRGLTPTARALGVRRAFVVGQVALAFVLLVSMSRLGSTLLSLLSTQPGFDPRGVMALQVSLPRATYGGGGARVGAFYAALQETLATRLGPSSFAYIDELPLTGDGGRRLVSREPTALRREAIVRSASSGYFEVMRMPVLAGRPFSATDGAVAGVPRIVVSESLAADLFGATSPVGRQIWVDGSGPGDIIGVVGDVKHRSLDEGTLPTVYFSATQAPSNSSVLVVRSGRAEADVVNVVRDEVAQLDSGLPVYRVRSMEDVVDSSPGLSARRVLTAAFTAFGLLALILSALGLFGVAAHDLACRRPELALRVMLGASPTSLLSATIGRGMVLVGLGLAIGTVLSLWAVATFKTTIATTGSVDPSSIAVAVSVLLASGICAVLPAGVRASRTDPRAVLSGE